MERKEFYRISSNGEGQVFSRSWTVKKPIGIVQIVHGMAEHSKRYDDFAKRLTDEGYNVYANDHTGHGFSKQGHIGTFALKKNGFDYVLQDMKTLYDYAEEESGELPKIMLGHSMGSILASLYAPKYKDVDGLILSGTVAPNNAVGMAIRIADLHIARKGYESVSPLLEKLTSTNNESVGDSPEAKYAWLSRDMDIARAYAEDPDCGFPFSASANKEMFLGLKKITSKDWAVSMPKIPVMLIAGAEDPVGNKGEAPNYYFDRLIESGNEDVALEIYKECKHEILNEINKEEVYGNVIDWMDDKIKEQLL